MPNKKKAPELTFQKHIADYLVREHTRRIKQAGEIVGIHLLDHIIFDPTTYFSFLEAGIL